MANEKPKIQIELEPGDYLVSVHKSGFRRIWKVQPTGEIVGMGRQIRRVAVRDALTQLTIAAEADEGIGDYPHLTAAKKFSDTEDGS